MHEAKEIFQMVENGGIIAILIAIIYYGQKQIDKLDNSIREQLKELSISFKEIQKETNQIIKEAIAIIARNHDTEPKINQAIESLKDALKSYRNTRENRDFKD